jgi:hypothetical protein
MTNNMADLQASQYKEMFGTLRDSLWSAVVDIFLSSVNKCQVFVFYWFLTVCVMLSTQFTVFIARRQHEKKSLLEVAQF